jgi:hypothetical protein
MTYDLLLTVFDSFTTCPRAQRPFLDSSQAPNARNGFRLKAILKPEDKITLNDLERLLIDEPFYLTAYQQARQCLTARYEAQELDRAEFQTQLTNLNKRCDVWINEPPATKDTIKMAIKGIFDAFGRIFH